MSRSPKTLASRRPSSRRRRGATTTEVALILAILVAGMLMAFVELGGRANSALSQLTGTVESGEGGFDPSPGNEPVAVNSPPITALASRVLPTTPAEWIRFSILAGLIVVALAAAGAIAFRKKQRVIPDDEPETAPPPTTTLPVALFQKRQYLLKAIGNSLSQSHLSDLPVALVMSRQIERIEPRMPREELRPRMKSAKVRHLAVCDDRGVLLGVVSDRDLGTREGKTAAEIMSRSPITVNSELGLIPAVTLMINRGFSCLPVVDDGKLVGIFTTTDLLLAFQATVLMIQRPDALVAGFGPAPLPAEATV